MSWASTRLGIANWFGGTPTTAADGYTAWHSSPVAGVATLFEAVPTSDDELDFHRGLASGVLTGCKVLVTLSRQSNLRQTVGQGYRMKKYTAGLEVFGLSRAGHAEQAEHDFDAILDGLEARLYASTDHTFGGTVYAAGEGDFGYQTRREPAVQTERGRIYLMAHVEFEVWEFQTGV